tara:strand:+ start:269 stop:490 length:222 start_codon:yes stop_codon:yes gene_type:complete
MKNIVKLIFTLISIKVLLISNAYAYIDPGSGSIILQAILGAIAAGGLTIKIYWNKLKVFFKRKKTDKLDQKSD